MYKRKQKRKRLSDHTERDPPLSCSPSTEAMPCSAQMEVMPDEKPSHSGDPCLLPLQPSINVTDGSITTNSTMVQYQRSLSRAMFLKRSRHYYAHHYSRRNSANASTCDKGISSFDQTAPSKLGSQSNSLSIQHEESKGKAFGQPNRVRPSSSSAMNTVSRSETKMVCGVCQKPLKWTLGFLGNSVASNELSVVAVLACGHLYHAECLEQITNLKERHDPSCPQCKAGC